MNLHHSKFGTFLTGKKKKLCIAQVCLVSNFPADGRTISESWPQVQCQPVTSKGFHHFPQLTEGPFFTGGHNYKISQWFQRVSTIFHSWLWARLAGDVKRFPPLFKLQHLAALLFKALTVGFSPQARLRINHASHNLLHTDSTTHYTLTSGWYSDQWMTLTSGWYSDQWMILWPVDDTLTWARMHVCVCAHACVCVCVCMCAKYNYFTLEHYLQ